MPKIKTNKATSSRVSITKKGKIKHRKCGQNHFNARESGNITREKRRDSSIVNKKNTKTIKQLMPY